MTPRLHPSTIRHAPATITPQEFVARWRSVTLTERSSSQSHFIDLCQLLGEQTPVEADPSGE